MNNPVINSILRTTGFILALNAIALLLTLVLAPLAGAGIDLFMLFLPVVALSVWYGGVGAGVISILVAIFAVDFFLLSLPKSIDLLFQDLPRIAQFAVVAAAIVVFSANRKRRTETLHRLEAIVEASEDAIMGITPDGTIVTANVIAQRIYGFPPQAIKGRPISILFAPDHRDEIPVLLERIQGGERVSHFETIHTRYDGELVDMSLNITPLALQTGQIIGASVIARDMTLHKRAELWMSKFSSAVEYTTDIVFITDRAGVIEYVNPAFETITGYSSQQALGKTPRIIKSGVHGQKFYQEFWKQILSGRVFRAEYTNRKKDGELYYEEKTITPIKDPQGNITHFVSTGKDVSERVIARQLLKKRVDEQTRELSAIYDVTALASASVDLKTILDSSLDRILAAMNTATGHIHLLNETEDTLQTVAAQGRFADLVRDVYLLAGDAGPVGTIAAQGTPLAIPDLVSDSPTKRVDGELAQNTEHVAFVGVPIRAQGRIIGVLSIMRETTQPFSADDTALLVSLGDHLGISVEHIRLFEQAQSKAATAERERLAHELHDSVTQSLYSMTLLAEAARRSIASGSSEAAGHYVSRVSETAQQSLKEMRLLVYELKPLALEQSTLVEALRQRLESVEKRAGVQVDLQVDPGLKLPVSMEEALYRVAQQALNNALKHAFATTVVVTIHCQDDCVELEILDNGRGFDMDKMSNHAGMGLVSMRRRVERLGGSLSIESKPGVGTQVMASIPLQ